MNVKKDILWRVYLAFFLVVLLSAGVVVQMFRLQTVKRTALKQMADSLTTTFEDIYPIRGNIYAADGSLMATSIPNYEVRMDMKVEGLTKELWDANIDSLSWCMSNYFKDKPTEQYKNEFKQARRKKNRYFLIKRKLSHTQIKDIKKFPLFRLGKYKSGLITMQTTMRKLPFQKLAMRTVGFTREGVRPVGIEGAFNYYLAGETGKRLMQRISGGVKIPINDENEIEPKDGQDIITTIDVNFQDITETALEKALMDNGADHGCAIVMETSTGHIKAIANLTHDGENYIEKYNYGIGESAEPGSTFKLVSVMALLDNGKASPNTIINTEGGQVKFFDRTMRDSKGGHGNVTLKQGFEISSNVAISKAVYNGFSKEPSKFTNYIASLGLNKPLGLPIFGEGHPTVKTPRSKDWYGTTLPWMSIGYEIRLTPLQTLTVYNAVANNGKMVKPQFVTEIREVGNLVQQFPTEVIKEQICLPTTLAQVKEMMEGVVENGTAKSLKNDLFKIAGKTGTSLVANEEGSYRQQGKYQASFVGYFPANKPAYTIIVVINNPTKGVFYGADVAGPVFKEISSKIYARTATTKSYLASFESRTTPMPLVSNINQEYLSTLMSIYKSNRNLQIEPDAAVWVKTKSVVNKLDAEPVYQKKNLVPNVEGMVLSDAFYILENAGLRVRFSGAGKVVAQSLEAGKSYKPKDIIQLQLN
jgi:cell division protein FtsI (penicillin-binding protein 3)